jgi:hypothetical protein
LTNARFCDWTADSNLPPQRTEQTYREVATGEANLALITALQRLIDLLVEEKDIPILAPSIHLEIIYSWLLDDQSIRL